MTEQTKPTLPFGKGHNTGIYRKSPGTITLTIDGFDQDWVKQVNLLAYIRALCLMSENKNN